MTPPTTDTSREAVKLAWDIGMGSVDGYDLDASRPEYKSAVALHAVALSLLAERDTLRDQLAAARNEALEEVGDELCRVCNGYAAEDNMTAATAICDAAMCVRALKPTPATSQRCAECDCENGGSDCTWISTPAPRDGDMTSQATPITFTYKNYRGEVATRTAAPKEIWFGTTEWHPEPGWLMTAYDLEKAADRDFALADCSFAPREVTPQEAALVLWTEWDEHGDGLIGELVRYSLCGENSGPEMQPDIDGKWVHMAQIIDALRAIAQETDDE